MARYEFSIGIWIDGEFRRLMADFDLPCNIPADFDLDMKITTDSENGMTVENPCFVQSGTTKEQQ